MEPRYQKYSVVRVPANHKAITEVFTNSRTLLNATSHVYKQQTTVERSFTSRLTRNKITRLYMTKMPYGKIYNLMRSGK